MDLFLGRNEIFLMIICISSLRCNVMNVSLPHQLQKSTLNNYKSLNETQTTIMFVNKNNREDYDFLFSDQNFQIVHKTKNSYKKSVDLKQIIPVFDDEHGGMVIDDSERNSSELREPTLPADLLDDLECVTVISDKYDSEENSQSDRNESDYSELQSEQVFPQMKSKLQVKPQCQNTNRSDKYEDPFMNVFNIFNDKEGLIRMTIKPKSKLVSIESTLPEIALDSDLHVSVIKSDDDNEQPHENEAFISDRTVDRTAEEDQADDSNLNEQGFQSSDILFQKPSFKTQSFVSEHYASNIAMHTTEKHKTLTVQRKSMTYLDMTASEENLDNLVNNFIALQSKNRSCIHREITHYLNVNFEEYHRKTKYFRRKTGKSKALTLKEKSNTTKRRGRPKKPTTNDVHLLERTERNILFVKKPKNGCFETQISSTEAAKIEHLHDETKTNHKKLDVSLNLLRKESTLTVSMNTHFLKPTNQLDLNISTQHLEKTDVSNRSLESEFSEDPGFTVIPILDSNMFNALNEHELSITLGHRINKAKTQSTKLFKNIDEKLEHLREFCTKYGRLITPKMFHINITTLEVLKNDSQNLSQSLQKDNSEVEDLPIIDFANPLRIIEHRKRQKEHPWNLKIGSWNVNGIRAWAKKGGFSFIKENNLDVFCIQEVRCPADKIPKCPSGYHSFWFPGNRQGYAGVAILSRTKPINVTEGFPSNEEDALDDGRVMTVEYEKFHLVNVYIPTSRQDLSMLPQKLKWNSHLYDHVGQLNKTKPVVIAGDFNVAHQEIDVALALTHKNKSSFTPQERDDFSRLLSSGFVDTYRHLYPDHRIYSYWPYYDRSTRSNGWRIDYFLISSQMIKRLSDQEIHCNAEGSDHVPLILYLNL